MKKLNTIVPALCWLINSIFFFNASAQTAGILDSSFAVNGAAVVPVGPVHDVANDFVVLPDGKILAAGSSSDASFIFHAALVRLNEDGTLDDSFGTNGTMTINVSEAGDFVYAMKLLPDGKVIIAGGTALTGYDYQFFAMKIDQDGVPDESFGESGVSIIPIDADEDYAHALDIQPDGKIVLAGATTVPGFTYINTALVRLTADGSIDSTFGTNGIAIGSAAPSESEETYGLVIMPDGSMVTTGYAMNGTQTDIILYKFDSNGNPDLTFGGTGSAIFNLNPGDDAAWDIGVNPIDNRLLVAGRIGQGISHTDFMIASIKQDGTLDSTFGVNGIASLNLKARDAALGMAFQSNGKIVITGGSGGTGLGDEDWATCRFDQNGKIDSTFGTNGVTLSVISSFFSEAHAVRILNDGKILTAGQASSNDNDFAVVRYSGDDVATPAEILPSENGISVYPNPVTNHEAIIHFNASLKGKVSIKLYDVRGILVTTLMNGDISSSSHLQVHLPNAIPSGYYFIQVENAGDNQVHPIMIAED